ncbi:centromere protein M-like isoform 1 [Cricetulus griseus]|nr:centromere protein M-like isoform 1 [Cricetulus griseus]
MLQEHCASELRVHLANSLPLPSTVNRPRIDLIVFVINLHSKYSLRKVEECLSHVDSSFFLGKVCFLATGAGRESHCSIHQNTVIKLARTYRSPLLFCDLEVGSFRATMAQRLVRMLQICAGHVPGISAVNLLSLLRCSDSTPSKELLEGHRADSELCPTCVRWDMGARKREAKSRRSRDSPMTTPCVQTLCFDPLVRHCVACNLLRTPDPLHASSHAPGTALQPQESVGTGPGPDTTLPLPGLLFGAPALLGLMLALALVALVTWRWWQQRRMASPGTPDGVQEETLHASAPIWPTPKEDVDTTLPGHSIPVPATELGSTELVTTKTAGPEE